MATRFFGDPGVEARSSFLIPKDTAGYTERPDRLLPLTGTLGSIHIC